MAATIKQTEAIPASYPTVTGLSLEAAAVDPNMIWQRIEAWIAHRYTARAVTWIIEGAGEWNPPLAPATVSAVEVWTDGAWLAVTPEASPLGGYVFDCDGPYRVTANVGGGTAPAAVQEAFRRLAEYMSDGIKPGIHKGRSGASSGSYSIGQGLNVSFDRNPAWMARAMANSGAGDLLRPYRSA